MDVRWVLVVLLWPIGVARAEPAAPRVDLLTMSPGRSLYTRFGHAAFHVVGPGVDRVYNYGYTDFKDPHLVSRFLRGQARFWGVSDSLQFTLAMYYREGRQVQRQTLRLSATERDRLVALLEESLREDRKYYVYHHFYDNCSTRLRDLLDRALGGELRRALRGLRMQTTLREQARAGLRDHLALLAVVDLAAGRDTDREIDAWTAGFLPELLALVLQRVQRPGGALASPPLPIFARTTPRVLSDYRDLSRLLSLAPMFVLLPLGVLALRRRDRRLLGLHLLTSALLLGVLALLPWTLAILSRVPELQRNELLLLFCPLDLLLAVWAIPLLRRRSVARRSALRAYLGLRALAVVAIVGLQLAGLLAQRPVTWIAVAALPLWLGYLTLHRLVRAESLTLTLDDQTLRSTGSSDHEERTPAQASDTAPPDRP